MAVLGGGASEGIEDGLNGFAVKNDAAAFADAVLRVLGDEVLYADLSLEAAKSVRGLGVSDMAHKVIAVYREAMGMNQEAMEREGVRAKH